MNPGAEPNLTLDEHRRDCADPQDVKRFGAMAFDGKNFVMCNRNCFERDAALGA